MYSHYEEELWGLAPHPKRAEVCTFDRSGMLAKWALSNKKQRMHT